MVNEVIYKGWPGMQIAPEMSVDMAPDSRTFGWLMARHPDGQWVTLADLKPLAARICADRA